MNAQELLDRYIHEVGRKLPRKLREDVKAELRSLLEETLNERAAQAGRAVDADLAVDVLREFGEPDTVALRYQPAQYLIGPAYFPAFLTILRIVFSVLGALFLAATIYSLIQNANSLNAALSVWVESMMNLVGLALANFGLLVVIFFIIERVDSRQKTESKWNPRDLPAVEDHDKINRAEMVGGLVFLIVLLAAFNFFPNLLSFFFITDGVWGRWPALTETFRQNFVPWLSLLWLAEIALRAIVLARGRWRVPTRLAELGINVLGLAFLYQVIRAANIFTPSFFDSLIKIGLVVVLIIGVIECCVQVYRLITRLISPAALSFHPQKR